MNQEKEKSVFEVLNAINVNDHTEKKNGLTYLSWSWAWSEIKKAYPDASYTVYENQIPSENNAAGYLVNYFTDGKTCWVKTGVTINGLEYIEYLPVMDFRNKSIPFGSVTSFDVNKTIQRSLTKACARHGLGLYIYSGEDLPEEVTEQVKAKKVVNNINYKQLLMDKLKQLGIDVTAYAKEHKLNAKTTQERAKELLEELNNASSYIE